MRGVRKHPKFLRPLRFKAQNDPKTSQKTPILRVKLRFLKLVKTYMFSYILGPGGSKNHWKFGWRPKMVPRWPQDDFKMTQDGSKMAQDGPRWPQDGPRWAQEGFKMAQGGPKKVPKWLQAARRLPDGGWLSSYGRSHANDEWGDF